MVVCGRGREGRLAVDTEAGRDAGVAGNGVPVGRAAVPGKQRTGPHCERGGGRLLTRKWESAIAAAASKTGRCPMQACRCRNHCEGRPGASAGEVSASCPPSQSRTAPVLHERCFLVHLNRCRHPLWKKGILDCCCTVSV